MPFAVGDRPKSLYGKGLRPAGRGPIALSPLVVRGYLHMSLSSRVAFHIPRHTIPTTTAHTILKVIKFQSILILISKEDKYLITIVVLPIATLFRELIEGCVMCL